MLVRVQEVLEQDSFETQNGTFYGSAMRATDANGNDVFIKVNAKKPGAYGPGMEFEFTPNGKFAGSYQLGKREQSQGGFQNRPQNAQNRPQSAPQGQGGAQVAKPVPTMSQAVSVLAECIEAVKPIGGSDAHATTLFLARLRGDIRRDPTEAETQAAAAAEAAKAKAAAEAAEKARVEAERQAALAAMPAAPADDSMGVPF